MSAMLEEKDPERNSVENIPDLLPLYYKRLFPHKHFARWLTYGGSESSIFRNREISFTFEDDIYVRYLSFDNPGELEKEIRNRNPHKIDIGAIYTDEPKKYRSANNMKPIQRELVFDIDMTDYDEVRSCCEGAAVCNKCWKFMSIACQILDTALREDFGFEHLLWVFSGRRGIHCWVCDKIARNLNTKGREAIAEYLQITNSVSLGDNSSLTKVNIIDKPHHSVKRALKIIEPIFEELCVIDQNLFSSQSGINRLVQYISDENVRKDLELHLKRFDTSNSKIMWDQFKCFFQSLKVNSGLSYKLKYIVEEIQLAILYPRLDINVTKGFNHLLKSPFCIHPSTGKVCVPFNPSAAGKFDPTVVPTVNTLVNEISAFDKDMKDDDAEVNRIKDYKKTGMFKGVLVFDEFLRKLETSCKIKNNNNTKMDF
ncbi:DNA primase small subunit [Condylostylus longicornis]|uniref:DNA primase small subunit n=1 Tax=Condylostylus longicornis TaxID=2530218 RepID=UPI00244DE48D|nr:DNA primase small subunit [Condylostylus longicornis]